MTVGHRLEIPTPFSSGRLNCYVFTDDGLTVLDPGPATETAYEALTTGLAEYGLSVSAVDRVLITHPHMDHFGLASRVVKESGASVLAHRDAINRLQDPFDHYDREVSLLRPYFETMGVPAQTMDTAIAHSADLNRFQEPVVVDQALTDGDTVDVGDSLRAIHTPGHAPGSVCFISLANAEAYTGDHVLDHLTPNPRLTVAPGAETERTRSLPTYLAALEKLSSVDAEIGHGGHGQPITDLHGRIQQTIDHHYHRKGRIASGLEEHGPATAHDVMRELFPDLPATHMFLGMSEVIGHLDLLEDEGGVGIDDRDGIRYYRRR